MVVCSCLYLCVFVCWCVFEVSRVLWCRGACVVVCIAVRVLYVCVSRGSVCRAVVGGVSSVCFAQQWGV